MIYKYKNINDIKILKKPNWSVSFSNFIAKCQRETPETMKVTHFKNSFRIIY